MEKSLFDVPRMDCAAEENLVRMKLDSDEAVRALEFDLDARQLTVYHEGNVERIEDALRQLNLGSTHVNTDEADDLAPESNDQRKLLWAVLLINAAFFVIEMTTGLVSRSMSLVADSLDMLADAVVYSLSLLAVGTTAVRKKRVAKWSGYLQLALAVFGLTEVVRRSIGAEALPDYGTMIVVALFALAANVVCLVLLQRSRSGEAHMRASMIFTSNDIAINLGVILAGVLVSWLNSGLPDLIVGAVVFLIVTRGAFRILSLAR